jgi:isoleucyl-tRNA synthetase
MPFAQVHYPFENSDWFDSHSPGDYIVEYSGQTRGWFYTLHVLSTALFDRPAFKTAVSHGIVLGSDGQKMSKSLRNYPDVNEVFDRDGSDAMRWFLLSSPILRGGTMSVTEQGIREGTRQVLLPLWNTYYFFTLYANASGYEAKFDLSSEDVLDRYLVAKTREMVAGVSADLNGFDTFGAAARLRDFADVLTNWYVRRSRARFWDGDAAAFNTLYSVLEIMTRVAAPMLPLIAEEVFQGLTGMRSVHLTEWPDHEALKADDKLMIAMDQVRVVSSVANGLRKVNGLRVRLPLAKLTVVTKNADDLSEFVDIIAEELNVKSIDLVELSLDSTTEFGVIKRLTVNSRALGPRVGKQVQQVIGASKSGDWSQDGDKVICGGIELIEGEYEIDLVADLSDAAESVNLIGILPSGGFVLLDSRVTKELEVEGIARDVIRAVQQARKDADLDVSDRIKLVVTSVQDVIDAIATHEELVKSETLTLELETTLGDVEGEGVTVGEDLPIGILVKKI